MEQASGHAPSQPYTPVWGIDEFLKMWGRSDKRVFSVKITNTVQRESATDRGVYTIHALEDATRGYKYKERGNQGTEIKENTSVVGVNSEDGNVEVVGHATGQALNKGINLRDTGNNGPEQEVVGDYSHTKTVNTDLGQVCHGGQQHGDHQVCHQGLSRGDGAFHGGRQHD